MAKTNPSDFWTSFAASPVAIAAAKIRADRKCTPCGELQISAVMCKLRSKAGTAWLSSNCERNCRYSLPEAVALPVRALFCLLRQFRTSPVKVLLTGLPDEAALTVKILAEHLAETRGEDVRQMWVGVERQVMHIIDAYLAPDSPPGTAFLREWKRVQLIGARALIPLHVDITYALVFHDLARADVKFGDIMDQVKKKVLLKSPLNGLPVHPERLKAFQHSFVRMRMKSHNMFLNDIIRSVAATPRVDRLTDLPDELLVAITEEMDPVTVARFASTCVRARSITAQPKNWLLQGPSRIEAFSRLPDHHVTKLRIVASDFYEDYLAMHVAYASHSQSLVHLELTLPRMRNHGTLEIPPLPNLRVLKVRTVPVALAYSLTSCAPKIEELSLVANVETWAFTYHRIDLVRAILQLRHLRHLQFSVMPPSADRTADTVMEELVQNTIPSTESPTVDLEFDTHQISAAASTPFLLKCPEKIRSVTVRSNTDGTSYLGPGSFQHLTRLSLLGENHAALDKTNFKLLGTRCPNLVVLSVSSLLSRDQFEDVSAFPKLLQLFAVTAPHPLPRFPKLRKLHLACLHRDKHDYPGLVKSLACLPELEHMHVYFLGDELRHPDMYFHRWLPQQGPLENDQQRLGHLCGMLRAVMGVPLGSFPKLERLRFGAPGPECAEDMNRSGKRIYFQKEEYGRTFRRAVKACIAALSDAISKGKLTFCSDLGCTV
jgi:hypothetical protein